ncbi:DUF2399 domain-containing protein [Nonomuraea sp. NPDC052265]|uniref:DUF2399 domain-containing protein n=1 Tax=Nonomuraea sp. NPDC052265 TaxID=3364374 RepID=UPI0037CCAF89
MRVTRTSTCRSSSVEASILQLRLGWQRRRFDAASYRAVPSSAPLAGQVRPTPWDPELSVAMERRGVRVEEELVLAELMADLKLRTSL